MQLQNSLRPVGAAVAAIAAGNRRRDALLVHIGHGAAAGAPAGSNEALAVMFAVKPETIRDDFRRLRAAGVLETDTRKFQMPGNGTMTVERRIRVRAMPGALWSLWSPWPTTGKPARPKRSGGVPPQFWSGRRERVSAAATAPDQVEQAKDIVRRLARVPVYHLSTVEAPDRVFVPRRRPAGAALVVIGAGVMPETAVVALAARLQSANAASRAAMV